MEFVKFRQSLKSNFSHIKKEIEELNSKMDELQQLLLEVNDKITIFIFSNSLLFVCFLIFIIIGYATSS